jgi:hypothetical protein
MKVKDLIEQLKDVDPDRTVIMSKDAEGNGYSPLYNMSEEIYCPDSTYSGEVYIEKLTDELRKLGYTDEDLAPEDDRNLKALVLGPTN